MITTLKDFPHLEFGLLRWSEIPNMLVSLTALSLINRVWGLGQSYTCTKEFYLISHCLSSPWTGLLGHECSLEEGRAAVPLPTWDRPISRDRRHKGGVQRPAHQSLGSCTINSGKEQES